MNAKSLLLFSLVSCLIVGPAAARDQEDLPNTHEVHEYLWRGGEPTKAGLERLVSMNVKTVFDLRNPGEKKIPEGEICKSLGIKYVALPMSSAPPTRGQVDKVMTAIKRAKVDSAAGKIFVHCAHGSDRTGCIIGIFRVTQDGYTYEDAYKEMRKYYFSPKFTKLSGAVREYAQLGKQAAATTL